MAKKKLTSMYLDEAQRALVGELKKQRITLPQIFDAGLKVYRPNDVSSREHRLAQIEGQLKVLDIREREVEMEFIKKMNDLQSERQSLETEREVHSSTVINAKSKLDKLFDQWLPTVPHLHEQCIWADDDPNEITFFVQNGVHVTRGELKKMLKKRFGY